MTERKFRKMLREHPDLISDEFVRSASESREFVKASTLTPELIVQRARLHLDLPDETWAHAEQTLTKIRRRDKCHLWLSSFSKIASTAFQSHRRLAIASILILLALAFFTLVPTGQALAKAAFDYIINIIGQHVEIVSADYENGDYHSSGLPPTLTSSADFSMHEFTTEYSSLEEFSAATNLNPFMLDDDGLICTSIIENSSEYSGRSLLTDYELGTDGILTITQRWMPDGKIRISGNDSFDNSFALQDGTIVYYSIDDQDGSFNAIFLLETSTCQIYVNKEPYISHIMTVMQNH